ncbi:hexosaminidase D-like [Ostrinia furnacalis]|uniref:hexosaminidase D-like n=1 Tax=Ostrinia furnacalis TaxID=93504 RepID=UPI00103C93CB|nr:hexosaminidase D-like [Ostrinia furnacalis]
MRCFLNNARKLRMRFILLALAILSLYLFISYILLEVWFVKSGQKTTSTPVSVSLTYVTVHVDLKGTPLKLSYLESLLPLMKENGVNSLLMEYEDMFPYEGKLANLSAENCYKKPELERFIYKALKVGIEIIPLVQTFGHLEYALKLEEFKHLREEVLYPDSICPSKRETMVFLAHMIGQIMDFHNSIRTLRYIHVGCDEVFHINKCQHCLKRDLVDMDIFLRHVKTLSDVMKSQYSDTTVLIWDDMLRGIKPGEWDYIEGLENVQPVCWDYGTEIQISHANLFKYHKKFQHLWISTAFKGADGRTATFPDLRNRFMNTYSWMNMISNYKFGGESQVYNFRGVILTGWSRYSHMDAPCELLPVAIPSLILNLMVIQKFKSGVTSDEGNDFLEDFFNKYLGTEMIQSLKCVIDIDNFDNSECEFDGKQLYEVLKAYTTISGNLDDIFNDDKLGLKYVEFYSKFNFINKNIMSNHSALVVKYLKDIMNIENCLAKEMSKYYESEFVVEYVNYKISPIKKKLQRLLNIYDVVYNVSTWTRRSKNNNSFAVT